MTPRCIRPPLPRSPLAEVTAARSLAAEAMALLERSAEFSRLAPRTQQALLRDLGEIQAALADPGAAPSHGAVASPLESAASLRSRLGASSPAQPADGHNGSPEKANDAGTDSAVAPKAAATDTLARRAGALSDEIDFPAFVAGLVHGTFDAIVDSAIRQMESFAELVSAIARDSQSFTRDNVTVNQARDWLLQHYPQDLTLELKDPETGQPRLRARQADEDAEPTSPGWLKDFGLEGQQLTDELIEEQLVPTARQRVGDSRLQMLATMVLLGLNRIVVRDGSISARVRFRAVAHDLAKVDYAVSQDPAGGSSWGSRGSNAYVTHDTKISTVGVNVQAESDLKAELFGEVKINFASETLPLDRFVDQARLTLLQSHSRPVASLIAGAPPVPGVVSAAPPMQPQLAPITPTAPAAPAQP